MFHIVLYQPEIPSNTGNIIRLCANTGTQLHLIHPLGFDMEDKKLKRAGLDYHEFAQVQEHVSLQTFLEKVQPGHIYACSTKGKHSFYEVKIEAGDALLFGPETRGLPEAVREQQVDAVLRIPMLPGSRSLNLANTVAIVAYEAWRRHQFHGANG